MGAIFSIEVTEQFQRRLQERAQAVAQLPALFGQRLEESLTGMENQIKLSFVGYAKGAMVGSGARQVRSGALRQAVMHKLDEPPFSGVVGVGQGPASVYARMQLGGGKTTVKPVAAKHLWIPIADNVGPGGITRMSPREAMELRGPGGKRALRIFRSQRGNLVAFLPGEVAQEGGQAVVKGMGSRFKRGPKKGQIKGKLLFVLKAQVVVQGNDAITEAVEKGIGGLREGIQRVVSGVFGER